ncbi:unnamed protein product, partial [Schistocephalus solidus]|uniref:RRM domain-containing protein n=1 Tax=Schistocephalus solidus TaxID=70667 RepID=A0A183TH68_SCHSO
IRAGNFFKHFDIGFRHEDLRRTFGRFGPIVDVTIPTDYYSGRMKGFAFVEYPFRDAEDAHRNMDHSRFLGRRIEVEFTRGVRKSKNVSFPSYLNLPAPAEMRDRDRRNDSNYRRRSRSITSNFFCAFLDRHPLVLGEALVVQGAFHGEVKEFGGITVTFQCQGLLLGLQDYGTSESDDKRAELRYLQRLFMANGYHRNFIERSRLAKPRQNLVTEQPKFWHALPYIDGVSEAVSRLLRPLGIGIAHRQDSTIRNLVMRPKAPLPRGETSNIIYRIQCDTCEAAYQALRAQIIERKSKHGIRPNVSSTAGEPRTDMHLTAPQFGANEGAVMITAASITTPTDEETCTQDTNMTIDAGRQLRSMQTQTMAAPHNERHVN